MEESLARLHNDVTYHYKHKGSLIIVDEFAFLGSGLAEEFIASTFPALSSSETSKLVLISTPYGLNHFYKIWHDSEQGNNNFARVEGKWEEARSD